jgi:hypothetical protein
MMLVVIGFHFDSLRKVLGWRVGEGEGELHSKKIAFFLHQKYFYFKLFCFKKYLA